MATILGIETSCDETAAAVVRDGRCILSSIVASQVDIHAKYGGVVPELASRAHVDNILPVIADALGEAGLRPHDVDAVAVVHRPGLIGALLIGVSAAKTLAWALGKPLVPVNHIEAHVYAGLMEEENVRFPFVALVASGGHTSLFHVEDLLHMERVGRTLDDAAGEAFDKAAALLNLEYPGGPSIEKAALQGDSRAHAFPRAHVGEYDFSFSGLKTACLYLVRGSKGGHAPDPNAPRLGVPDIAAAFQEAVVDVLVDRTASLAADRSTRDVILGGGVACNGRLRTQLADALHAQGRRLVAPSPRLCTDNAAMVAGLAFHLLTAGKTASLHLDAHARDIARQSRNETGPHGSSL